MFDWVKENESLMYWLMGASGVLLVVTLVAAAIVILRLPPDYFAHDKRPPREGKGGPVLRVLKNVLGVICLVIGVALLILPGQGVLTLIVGLVLVDFPGRYKLLKKLVGRKGVMKTLNWWRRKWDKEPLEAPSKSGKDSGGKKVRPARA